MPCGDGEGEVEEEEGEEANLAGLVLLPVGGRLLGPLAPHHQPTRSSRASLISRKEIEMERGSCSFAGCEE